MPRPASPKSSNIWAPPTSLAISPKDGRIYLCDVGAGQCMWIFDPVTGKQVGTVGKVGGVYKNTVPGRVDAQHLFFPRAVTLDDDGNVYVACARVRAGSAAI